MLPKSGTLNVHNESRLDNLSPVLTVFSQQQIHCNNSRMKAIIALRTLDTVQNLSIVLEYVTLRYYHIQRLVCVFFYSACLGENVF